MQIKDHPLNGGNIQKLIEILGANNKEEILNAINQGYRIFYIPKKDGTKRPIETPNKKLKKFQSKLKQSLQMLDNPNYNKCGWKGQNTIQNVLPHVNAHTVVVADISKYYPNTRAKYVRKFFKLFNVDDETLDILVKLTTFKNHLPTGIPTGSILAFLTHMYLFEEINQDMQKHNITMTLYADDITLSAKHGITNQTVRYIKHVLTRHKLQVKPQKTMHFSYKKAKITGYYISQNGKVSASFKTGHEVVQLLKEKPLCNMTEKELLKILGKIEYIRQVDKNAFKVTRFKIIKHLKQLQQYNKTIHELLIHIVELKLRTYTNIENITNMRCKS